jgi:hypothetical protein
LFAQDGELVAALTISGVASRWNRDALVEAAKALKRAAEKISRQLGQTDEPPDLPTVADLEDPRSEASLSLEKMIEQTWTR